MLDREQYVGHARRANNWFLEATRCHPQRSRNHTRRGL